jgi:hypothetical protein
MDMSIKKYIEDGIATGSVKIYPYSKDIKDLGFYMIIHQSTRIEKLEHFYQCTLFLGDKPYCHDIRPLGDIIKHIENTDYKLEDGILYSMICDESVMELAECTEIPSNKKTEDIHKIVIEYDDRLSLIQDEKVIFLIKSLFDEYIKTDKYTIEQVESILNSLLR